MNTIQKQHPFTPSIGGWGVLLLCCLLAACGTKKQATTSDATLAPLQSKEQTVNANRQDDMCVTAKANLSFVKGDKSVSLGGILRMKRNDVIQLSLVTFGILEVARIEITPDYFMAIDKMGRRYVKAAYSEVPFLKSADVDFRTIQTYFWDEQASSHKTWERSDFVTIGDRKLPTKHRITIQTSKNTIVANIKLSNLTADSEWETRTKVPASYTQVAVDELLSHLISPMP